MLALSCLLLPFMAGLAWGDQGDTSAAICDENGAVRPIDINYGEDVEVWWARQVFNPEREGHCGEAPTLPGGTYEVKTGRTVLGVVKEASSNNIEESKTIIVDGGVTLYGGWASNESDAEAAGKLINRSNVHIVCHDEHDKARIQHGMRVISPPEG